MGLAASSRLSARVVRGVGANIVAQAVSAVGQLVLVPVFLHCWGRQSYGEWLTLSAAVGYLAVVDFGMQMYVINRLNQCHAMGETGEYNRILHSAYFLSLVVSTVSFLILSAGMAFVPFDRWFRFSATGRSEAWLVTALLAGQVAFSIPQGLILGIYRTIGEYPRGVMVANVQKTFAVAGTLALLIAGGGMPAVAAVQIVPMAAAAAFVWRDLRRRDPRIRLGIRERDVRLALSFLAPSFFFFLIQAAMALTLQGSTLVAGAILGASAVAVFATTRTLANALRQLFSTVYHALWPELTSLEAAKRFETLREIFLLSSKAMLLASVCGAAFLNTAGASLFRLWTRGGIDFDRGLMAAFLLLLASQTYWLSAAIFLASSNNHRVLSACYGVSGALGLSLGYLIGKPLGLPGIVVGLVLADLAVCAVLVPWRACRHIGQDYGRYAAEVLVRGVPVALLVFAAVRLVSWAVGDIPPLLFVVVVGGSAAAAGFPAGYLLWFRPAERRRLDAILFETLPAPFGRFFARAQR